MKTLVINILIFLLAYNVHAESSSQNKLGERLYRQGILPSGQPLVAARENGVNIEGALAACISCHRRSGLGTQEGRYVIPPITGKYLFKSAEQNAEDINLPHVLGYRSNRAGYTDTTLAVAIRDGIDADGKTLNYLMPRFKLDDPTMTMLIEYLKKLTTGPVPGVSDDTLHFATIITPDADPDKRKGMLDVLNQFFTDKNSFIRGGVKPMHASKEVMYRVTRKWQLHVWELTGEPETWKQQLEEKMTAEPVFAIVSGLSPTTWEPIHQFCENEGVPCLFPNLDLPIDAENDFYPVYFSKGVILESQLLVQQLEKNHAESRPRHIFQIFREGDIGEIAAKSLKTEALQHGYEIVNRILKIKGSSQELANALQEVSFDDALILWLRPHDLTMLPKENKIKFKEIYFSGLMGGLEDSPIPNDWRPDARMTYPFDMPEQRKIRMNFPLTWLKIKHISIVDERLQTDTYLACGILAETLSEMLDSFVRDYLVERIEVMLSHRVITGYYPRLGLAPGQRFASKGGYIVQFSENAGKQLTADSEWTVP